MHENLGRIPGEAKRGTLAWWDQYFIGAGLTKVVAQDLPGDLPLLRRSRLELEGLYVHHFGTMQYPEVAAALHLRTPDLAAPGGLSVNGAVGYGLSYTLKMPHLESVRTDRTAQKLLAYLSFELELTHAALPAVQFVPRLHHRSGMFGLIGPKGDGSNYVGLGLRTRLR